MGTGTMYAVPGHEKYVLYPYGQNYSAIAKRCVKMGERCGVTVEVKGHDNSTTQRFWRHLMEETGGVTGQHDRWQGAWQRTEPLNSRGEYIRFHIGAEHITVYIRSGEPASPQRTDRMHEHSRMIRETMSDQTVENSSSDRHAREGKSVYIRKEWERENEEEWPEAAHWLTDQTQRLQALLSDPPEEV